jgi:hypothetical protein
MWDVIVETPVRQVVFTSHSHSVSVLIMMMMNVVVNRELGRDYVHLLSGTSVLRHSHVHFLQCA